MKFDEAHSEEQEKSNPMEDPEEQAHFKQVVSAFFNYAVRSDISLSHSPL